MNTEEKIESFLNKRPSVILAYGYGSGVTKQNGYSSKDHPQIDLILGVENESLWHLENIERNPQDYSPNLIKLLASKHNIYQNYGCPIIFMPYLHEGEDNFKIGVVNYSEILCDLTNWNNYCLAGRFQKPTLAIKTTSGFSEIMAHNCENAFILANLLMPTNYYSIDDLLEKIMSLSFYQDIRVVFGFENPEKAHNILYGGYDKIIAMYQPFLIKYFQNNCLTLSDNHFINRNPVALLTQIHRLPYPFSKQENSLINKTINSYDYYHYLLIQKMLLHKLGTKNFNFSTKMAIKGIISTDLNTSLTYALEKRKKHNQAVKKNKY